MKSTLRFLISFLTLGTFFFALSGCYTQLSTTRDEQEEDEEYATQRDNNDSSYTEDYDRDGYDYPGRSGYYDNYGYGSGYTNARIGFSYYYPSYYWPSSLFSAAYADPWFYDCYSYYDPWRCGTYSMRYPYYGYGYYSSYNYYPYYYRYPYYYSYNARPVKHGSREFGSTRGSSGGRGTINAGSDNYGTGRTGFDLPTGVARGDRSGGGVASGNRSAKLKESPRRVGGQRGYAPRGSSHKSGTRSDRSVRGSGSRRWNTRSDVRPDPQPQYQPSEIHTPSLPPPATRSTGNSGSTRVEQPRSSGREVGSSRSSPPPPSSSGRAPSSSGGSRGGSTRGNRP